MLVWKAVEYGKRSIIEVLPAQKTAQHIEKKPLFSFPPPPPLLLLCIAAMSNVHFRPSHSSKKRGREEERKICTESNDSFRYIMEETFCSSVCSLSPGVKQEGEILLLKR